MTPRVPTQPEPERTNRPLAFATLNTFAHHVELTRAFWTFNGQVLYGTSLTARQRHLIVLRVAAKRQCAFLWMQHLFPGHDAGLTDEEMGRVAFGPDAPFFTPLESALIAAVDELIDDGEIGDATWVTLAGELSEQQLLDVIFTAGCYETVAWFMRSCRLPVDPDIPRLLPLRGAATRAADDDTPPTEEHT